MHVDLIGAELGAALADLSEIERWSTVADAADRQRLGAAVGAAAHQHVVGGRHGRALEELVDAVDIALAGGAGPEVEAGVFVRPDHAFHLLFLGEGTLRPVQGELNDTRNHYCRSLRGITLRALFDALFFSCQPMPHCLTMPMVSSRIVAPSQCFCGRVNAKLPCVARALGVHFAYAM